MTVAAKEDEPRLADSRYIRMIAVEYAADMAAPGETEDQTLTRAERIAQYIMRGPAKRSARVVPITDGGDGPAPVEDWRQQRGLSLDK